MKDGESIIDWIYEEGAENQENKRSLHLEMKQYFGIGKYEVQWNMKRIIDPFKTTSFHRTLTEYVQTLYVSKLLVSRLVEPKPTLKAVSNYPSFKKRLKIPQSIARAPKNTQATL